MSLRYHKTVRQQILESPVRHHRLEISGLVPRDWGYQHEPARGMESLSKTNLLLRLSFLWSIFTLLALG